MSKRHVIAGVFDTLEAGAGARKDLIDYAIDAARIELNSGLHEDPIASEHPGQSFENQPGQGALMRSRASAFGVLAGAQGAREAGSARFNAALRSGACYLAVEAGSPDERRGVMEILERRGARYVGDWPT